MWCKLFFKNLIIFTVFVTFVCGELSLLNDENNTDNEITEITERVVTNSWLKSAQDVIASPAGHVVVQVAKELLNRSAGNSQVLSLNLTNLLIIVLLKVLIFAAGMLGAGHWSSYGGYARSAGHSNSAESLVGFDESEAYLITGFLAAQGSGINDCLYAAACSNPSTAYEYTRAAKVLLDGIEKFEGQPVNNSQYMDLIVLAERAAYDGYSGVPCNITIKCDGLW